MFIYIHKLVLLPKTKETSRSKKFSQKSQVKSFFDKGNLSEEGQNTDTGYEDLYKRGSLHVREDWLNMTKNCKDLGLCE